MQANNPIPSNAQREQLPALSGHEAALFSQELMHGSKIMEDPLLDVLRGGSDDFWHIFHQKHDVVMG